MSFKTIFCSLLLAGLAVAPLVHADDPYKVVDDARVKRDQDKYPFLYPGFRFLIQPAAEGGPSIAGLYDGDGGFILCYSGQNPSNEAVTAPFHCNGRITAIGYHVPADVIFGHPGVLANLKDIARIGGEFFLNAAGSVTQLNSVTSEVAQTAQAATNQSPIQEMIGHQQIKATMDRLYASAMKGWNYCDANPVTSPAPYYMTDLAHDFQERVRKYEKTCYNHKIDLKKKVDVSNPEILSEILSSDEATDRIKEDKDGAIYCHEQQHNQTMAAAVGELCNIQSVTAQAGEIGNAELWFPGQPVTKACRETLKSYVAKKTELVNGELVTSDFTDANGNSVHLGGPLLAWLNQQYKKAHGIAPSSDGENAAIALHVGSCLEHNQHAAEIEARLQADFDEGKDLVTEDPPATPDPNASAAPAASAPN